MTNLYLIRHGDYIEGLKDDGKYGDLGLSSVGKQQAECLRNRLAESGEIKADVFISSTMRRAQETAELIVEAVGQSIVLNHSFEEWRGDDGTLSPEEFMARWEAVPAPQRAYYRWHPDYENRIEFVLRMNQAFNEVLLEHANKSIVVMTHGGCIQASFPFFFGYGEASISRVAINVRHTSITHWQKQEGTERWILERSNDCSHLA